MIEREIISIQNIFVDVAIDVAIDVTNKMFENKISKIWFDWLINDMNINVDSFVVKNIAKMINIVIIVFELKKNVDIDTNVAFDVVFANSFDVNVAKIVDSTINAMKIRFAIIVFNVNWTIVVILTNFVFDVKKNVNIVVSLDANFNDFF